jgi:hypothetical protein
MINAFIIHYEYGGKKNFANVVEFKNPRSVFYITPINSLNDLPDSKLILRRTNDRFTLAEQSGPADAGLVDILSEQILYHLKNEA